MTFLLIFIIGGSLIAWVFAIFGLLYTINEAIMKRTYVEIPLSQKDIELIESKGIRIGIANLLKNKKVEWEHYSYNLTKKTLIVSNFKPLFGFG